MTISQDPLVTALLALQSFEGLTDPEHPDAAYDIRLNKLRKPLPVAILMHHYHRRQRRKRSIAIVSGSGACGHCHISLTRGILMQLTRSGELGTCPHCEGFLYMEQKGPVEPEVKSAASKKAKTPRKPKAAAAA